MLFSNLLVALALTVLFPLGLMGVLAASEWLERRTLAAEEVLPRRLRFVLPDAGGKALLTPKGEGRLPAAPSP